MRYESVEYASPGKWWCWLRKKKNKLSGHFVKKLEVLDRIKLKSLILAQIERWRHA